MIGDLVIVDLVIGDLVICLPESNHANL